MIESALIAMAICIDSFALGIIYGVKKIKTPKIAILIINLISIAVLGLSVLSGHIVRQFISDFTASLISCMILITLGFFFIFEEYIKLLISKKSVDGFNKHQLVNFRIPKLGIIIDIALDVTKADLDVSGDIDMKEALYIGFILSIDSLGAGFGYAVGGMNVLYFLTFVFVINIISLSYGLMLGKKVRHYKKNLKISLLPGMILIAIGILKCFFKPIM